jgi:hypothetical protein
LRRSGCRWVRAEVAKEVPKSSRWCTVGRRRYQLYGGYMLQFFME